MIRFLIVVALLWFIWPLIVIALQVLFYLALFIIVLILEYWLGILVCMGLAVMVTAAYYLMEKVSEHGK